MVKQTKIKTLKRKYTKLCADITKLRADIKKISINIEKERVNVAKVLVDLDHVRAIKMQDAYILAREDIEQARSREERLSMIRNIPRVQ
jgi:hypothetical protein